MRSLRAAAMARQRSFEERLAERLRSRKVEDAKLRARQAQGKIRRLINTNFRKQEMRTALQMPFPEEATRWLHALRHLREQTKLVPPLSH
jgi:hypothetical protein